MTTKAIRTIDDLGQNVYTQFEDNLAFNERKYVDDSQSIALQLTADSFEPILTSEHNSLFEIGTRGAVWGMFPPPPHYNDQRKRLFTHQLVLHLGSQDRIDIQISRIDEKSKETPQSDVQDEANKLILMMQDIDKLNKMIASINAERFRYSKG